MNTEGGMCAVLQASGEVETPAVLGLRGGAQVPDTGGSVPPGGVQGGGVARAAATQSTVPQTT